MTSEQPKQSEGPVRLALPGDIFRALPVLVAALELAKVNLRVQLLPEAPSTVSELVGQGDLLPAQYDDGTLWQLCTELAAPVADGGEDHAALTPELQPAAASEQHTNVWSGGSWVCVPADSLCGVPAVPMAQSVLAAVGGAGAARAVLDRVRPVLTIGKTETIGALVRSRMGGRVLATLVEPLVWHVTGLPASEAHVQECVPGLNEALTRAGSLSGGVQMLLVDPAWWSRHAPVRPRGGWGEVVLELLRRLELYGVQVLEAGAADVAGAAGMEAADDVAPADVALLTPELLQLPVRETVLFEVSGGSLPECDLVVPLPGGEVGAVFLPRQAAGAGSARSGAARGRAVAPEQSAAGEGTSADQQSPGTLLLTAQSLLQHVGGEVAPERGTRTLQEPAPRVGFARQLATTKQWAVRLRRQLLGLTE